MDSLFSDLILVLGREREVLKEMLDAARKHNNALRLNDIEVLKDVTVNEERLNGRLKTEDLRREEIHLSLVTALGLPRETPLSGLLPYAPGRQGESLSRITSELKEIARGAARLVELNGILTRRAMQFNEQILRLVNTGYYETYQSYGTFTFPAKCQPLLINKTV